MFNYLVIKDMIKCKCKDWVVAETDIVKEDDPEKNTLAIQIIHNCEDLLVGQENKGLKRYFYRKNISGADQN